LNRKNGKVGKKGLGPKPSPFFPSFLGKS